VRPKLTLKHRHDPATQPKVDPAKVALSEQLGVRFVLRDHRYLMQRLVVSYEFICDQNREQSRTWIDVPLVPEAYYP